jgi:hypothetical protein
VKLLRDRNEIPEMPKFHLSSPLSKLASVAVVPERLSAWRNPPSDTPRPCFQKHRWRIAHRAIRVFGASA